MANMDVPAAKAVHPAERSTRVTGATSEMPRLVSVSRGRYTSLGSAVALRQLPDLDAVRGEHGNEHAVSLPVVPDVGRARNARDELYLLTGLVARHGGITPARDEDLAADDHDAVEPARSLGDHSRRLVLRLPREHRSSTEFDDHEALAHGVERDPVRPAQRVPPHRHRRSEEHTSELQSPCNLVCRLLLEKKKKSY